MFGMSKHTSTQALRNALKVKSTISNIKSIKTKFLLNNDLVYRLIDELLLNHVMTLECKL